MKISHTPEEIEAHMATLGIVPLRPPITTGDESTLWPIHQDSQGSVSFESYPDGDFVVINRGPVVRYYHECDNLEEALGILQTILRPPGKIP